MAKVVLIKEGSKLEHENEDGEERMFIAETEGSDTHIGVLQSERFIATFRETTSIYDMDAEYKTDLALKGIEDNRQFKWTLYLGLDDVAYNAIKGMMQTYLATHPKPNLSGGGNYEGIPKWAARVFVKVSNRGFYYKVLKTPTIGGKVWHLFLLYFLEGEGVFIDNWLTDLEAAYPNRVEVVAAYNYKTGELAPGYSVHPQAYKFMPDVCDDSEPPVCVPATEWDPSLL